MNITVKVSGDDETVYYGDGDLGSSHIGSKTNQSISNGSEWEVVSPFVVEGSMSISGSLTVE